MWREEKSGSAKVRRWASHFRVVTTAKSHKIIAMKKAKIIFLMMVSGLAIQAQAGLLFNYSQLTLKDLDQMSKIVSDSIKESKKSAGGKEVPLKEALQAVYSRPNDDEMIEKIVGPLRTQLDNLDAWEKSISQLTDEAINALRNPKAFKPVVQVTYLVFLENLLAELKPYINKPTFERDMVTRIRNANVEASKEALNERKLRSMKATVSPSEIADQILKHTPLEKSTEKPADGQ